jgi:SSS family solute:Na+ symporter
MGLAFLFTVIVMVGLSLAGPRINPKAFELDREMFRLKPSTIALIVVTILILMALYVKFW